MYRDRGGSGPKLEIGAADRKRFSDSLDKHLEKSPPTASRVMDSKEKDKLSVPSISSGKQPEDPSLSNNKCSDGSVSSLFSCSLFLFDSTNPFFAQDIALRLLILTCELRGCSCFL